MVATRPVASVALGRERGCSTQDIGQVVMTVGDTRIDLDRPAEQRYGFVGCTGSLSTDRAKVVERVEVAGMVPQRHRVMPCGFIQAALTVQVDTGTECLVRRLLTRLLHGALLHWDVDLSTMLRAGSGVPITRPQLPLDWAAWHTKLLTDRW